MASTNDEADIDDSVKSGNPLIDGLLTEYHWSMFARANFQFTMPDSESDYEDTRDLLIDDYPDDNHIGVVSMPSFMRSAIRKAIAEYQNILPFQITEQGDNDVDTQLRFALASFTHDGDPNRPAYAYTPQDDGLFSEQANWMSGDSFYSINRFSTQDTPGGEMVGTYQYHTILHETGHALGLKHGHEEKHGNVALPSNRDSMEFTVMTYRSYIGASAGDDATGYKTAWGHFAQTLMMLDIQALQHLYGADFTTNASNTTYTWDKTGRYQINGSTQWVTDTATIFLTVWDGGGVDTYDFSAFDTAMQIDLAPGGWSNLGANLANLGDGRIARGNVFNALQYRDSTASLIENAVGGSAGDNMRGNALGNSLEGRDGDDLLYGNDGNDTLTGGAGADLINGGPGFDIAVYDAATGEAIVLTAVGSNPLLGRWSISGANQGAGDILAQIEAFRFGNGNDSVRTARATEAYSLQLDGRAGNDTITGGGGADTLIGGLGRDVLDPGLGVFQVFGGHQGAAPGQWTESLADRDVLVLDRSGDPDGFRLTFANVGGPTGQFTGADGSFARGITAIDYDGGAATDIIGGGLGNDTIHGRGGSDDLSGNAGADVMDGGDGADFIMGGEGNDTLRGGLGRDSIRGQGGDDVILPGGDRLVAGNTGDTQVFGDAGNDTITGTGEDERFFGGTEDDRLTGKGGRDTLEGDAGYDVLDGGDGDDSLYGSTGNDTLTGGDGNDYLHAGTGSDSLDGGAGLDRAFIDRTPDTAGIALALGGGPGSDGTVVRRVESMVFFGGRGGDTITGGDGADDIGGNDGNDMLDGAGGDDVLSGGADNDTLKGGPGTDRLSGGAGDDSISTGTGTDSNVFGDAGNDHIIGASGNQRLFGGSEDDRLFGRAGNDELIGDGGRDRLFGEGGSDTLQGGAGGDTLSGGAGNDLLAGGAENDRFVIAPAEGIDRITDFDANAAGGQDVLDVRAFGFGSFAAMRAAGVTIAADGAAAVITFAGLGTTVRLDAVAPAQLTASDFLF
jgi:serralysin